MTTEPDVVSDVSEAARWLATMQTAVAETVAGVMLRAARPVPVGVGGHGVKVSSSPAALVGYALRNLSAIDNATATIVIREYDANGAVVIPITLAPNESIRDFFGPGINFVDGVYVEITGEVDGTVWLRGAE